MIIFLILEILEICVLLKFALINYNILYKILISAYRKQINEVTLRLTKLCPKMAKRILPRSGRGSQRFMIAKC